MPTGQGGGGNVPPMLIRCGGPPAAFAWDEFCGAFDSPHTRLTYRRAAERLLDWLAAEGVELTAVSPGLVRRYLDGLRSGDTEHRPLSAASLKVHAAAIRRLFDALVRRHAVMLNPALSLQTPRVRRREGATPDATPREARALLDSVTGDRPIDHRDRVAIGLLIYTGCRLGAVASLRLADHQRGGDPEHLRLAEKGGQARRIPVHPTLRELLAAWRGVRGAAPGPLLPTVTARGTRLTDRPCSNADLHRMLKRRLAAAGLPGDLSAHSIRACVATHLLDEGVPLESVQHLLGHADPGTTRLYDRRSRRTTPEVIERIRL